MNKDDRFLITVAYILISAHVILLTYCIGTIYFHSETIYQNDPIINDNIFIFVMALMNCIFIILQLNRFKDKIKEKEFHTLINILINVTLDLKVMPYENILEQSAGRHWINRLTTLGYNEYKEKYNSNMLKVIDETYAKINDTREVNTFIYISLIKALKGETE